MDIRLVLGTPTHGDARIMNLWIWWTVAARVMQWCNQLTIACAKLMIEGTAVRAQAHL